MFALKFLSKLTVFLSYELLATNEYMKTYWSATDVRFCQMMQDYFWAHYIFQTLSLDREDKVPERENICA